MISGVSRIDGMGNPAERVWPQTRVLLASADTSGQTEINLPGSGSKIFLEVNVTPILGEKDQKAGHLLVFRNITERRQMEQDLRESEARYSTLVEQSNEGVLIILKGKIVYANRTILELSGYSQAELKGQPVDFLIQAKQEEEISRSQAKESENQAATGIYEMQICRKDGTNRIADMTEGIIRFAGDEARMVSVRDVTERKQTQQKLESLYAEEHRLRNNLQSEIDKRSKYTLSLVNELKTPLNSIAASIPVLEAEVKNDVYLALVKNISRASINLEQRIDELIELARGEVGMLKIDPVEMDLAVLLRDLVSEMTPVATAKGLVMLQDIPDLPEVLGEKGRLRQVVTNLLSNAIKFTTRGTILVKAYPISGSEVKVQISDTGRGLSDEEVVNIFDPYRRKLDSDHEMRGLGIGLALSKMLVEMHKGQIMAESHKGKGSTFSFTVPVYKKAEYSD
jgi:PAS domain S-box-containing protein